MKNKFLILFIILSNQASASFAWANQNMMVFIRLQKQNRLHDTLKDNDQAILDAYNSFLCRAFCTQSKDYLSTFSRLRQDSVRPTILLYSLGNPDETYIYLYAYMKILEKDIRDKQMLQAFQRPGNIRALCPLSPTIIRKVLVDQQRQGIPIHWKKEFLEEYELLYRALLSLHKPHYEECRDYALGIDQLGKGEFFEACKLTSREHTCFVRNRETYADNLSMEAIESQFDLSS